MKTIYFVQPNSLLGNSVYFPYAAGVIASYAFQFADIRAHYSLGGIVFKEDPFADVFRHLNDPYLVAFSNYFWNYQYNLDLAAAIKERFPECLIVFGGHQVTKDTTWLEENQFIDVLIHGEGEEPFALLLRNLAQGMPPDDIPNLAFRQKDGRITETEKKYIGIREYPSPYTTGVFDTLLNTREDLEFNAQLETNRGCPYHCSFCDWCSYDVPMRLFAMEKIKSDLQWISAHKISYCMCVDSNFGMFERDEEIVRYLVELKQNTGYPSRFGACFAKNKTDRIFRINKLLNANGMSKGVSLSFQSMSEEVLKNVSRSNMDKQKLTQQLAMYHEAGIPTYTELILGLPGETYESFCGGICELLDAGQHDSINVFRCEVYPNSDLADKAYMQKYGIKTARNKMNINHCSIADAVFSGGLDYIVETSTMTQEELAQANMFSCCIQGLHCHGLLQYIAIYLHNACAVRYDDFYNAFLRFFSERDGLIGSTLRSVRQSIRTCAKGEVDFSYVNPVFGSITWPYEEAILLNFLYESERFYREIGPFLAGYFANQEILDALMCFQKNMLVLPGENDTQVRFDYAFGDFFKAAEANVCLPLKKQPCTLHFYAPAAPTDWQEYARQIVWYGRRNKRTVRRFKVMES